MTTNFLAILEADEMFDVRRIRVPKTSQDELTEEFENQAADFLNFTHRKTNDDGETEKVTEAAERIDFFPVYTINDLSQIFEIELDLDSTLLHAAKAPDSASPLRLDDDTLPALRAICAAEYTKKSLTIYFQAIERGRLLTKNRMTFLQSADEFTLQKRPGFIFGNKIHAVYQDGKLLFRSFQVAARFVNLLAVFDEASNETITEVLDHSILLVGDKNAVAANADLVMRKQFTAVAELGVLDKVEPGKVKKSAADFGIDINVKTDKGKSKVCFPGTKREQKELLKFLTEGYYLGPITGNRYQSNSHRPLKPKPKGNK